MTKRTTTAGYWRAFGDSARSSTPGVMTACLYTGNTLDATLPGTEIETGLRIPAGAIVFRVDINTSGSGGTAPLVDVGIIAETPADVPIADVYVNGAPIDADSSVDIGSASAGTGLGTPVAYPSRIIVGDGGGTNATGGIFGLLIHYTFDDDGSQ